MTGKWQGQMEVLYPTAFHPSLWRSCIYEPVPMNPHLDNWRIMYYNKKL